MTILQRERYKPSAYRVNAFSFDLRHFLPLGGNLYYPVGENRLEGKIAKNKEKQKFFQKKSQNVWKIKIKVIILLQSIKQNNNDDNENS